MINCKEATQIMSQSQDRPLARMERLQLHFHLLLCAGCRHFKDQLAFMRIAAQRFGTGARKP